MEKVCVEYLLKGTLELELKGNSVEAIEEALKKETPYDVLVGGVMNEDGNIKSDQIILSLAEQQSFNGKHDLIYSGILMQDVVKVAEAASIKTHRAYNVWRQLTQSLVEVIKENRDIETAFNAIAIRDCLPQHTILATTWEIEDLRDHSPYGTSDEELYGRLLEIGSTLANVAIVSGNDAIADTYYDINNLILIKNAWAFNDSETEILKIYEEKDDAINEHGDENLIFGFVLWGGHSVSPYIEKHFKNFYEGKQELMNEVLNHPDMSRLITDLSSEMDIDSQTQITNVSSFFSEEKQSDSEVTIRDAWVFIDNVSGSKTFYVYEDEQTAIEGHGEENIVKGYTIWSGSTVAPYIKKHFKPFYENKQEFMNEVLKHPNMYLHVTDLSTETESEVQTPINNLNGTFLEGKRSDNEVSIIDSWEFMDNDTGLTSVYHYKEYAVNEHGNENLKFGFSIWGGSSVLPYIEKHFYQFYEYKHELMNEILKHPDIKNLVKDLSTVREMEPLTLINNLNSIFWDDDLDEDEVADELLRLMEEYKETIEHDSALDKAYQELSIWSKAKESPGQVLDTVNDLLKFKKNCNEHKVDNKEDL